MRPHEVGARSAPTDPAPVTHQGSLGEETQGIVHSGINRRELHASSAVSGTPSAFRAFFTALVRITLSVGILASAAIEARACVVADHPGLAVVVILLGAALVFRALPKMGPRP